MDSEPRWFCVASLEGFQLVIPSQIFNSQSPFAPSYSLYIFSNSHSKRQQEMQTDVLATLLGLSRCSQPRVLRLVCTSHPWLSILPSYWSHLSVHFPWMLHWSFPFDWEEAVSCPRLILELIPGFQWPVSQMESQGELLKCSFPGLPWGILT